MEVLHQLFEPSLGPEPNILSELLLGLLVAFIVGQLNAWCYRWTHRGVSYSRTFTQSLVLVPIVAAMSMALIAGNVVAAVGLLGGLAIIRFRTVVRDSRDTAYVFLSLICGMAAGFGYYKTAVAGACVANLVAAYMYATGFGAWYATDSLLRFEIRAANLNSGAFEETLRRFCRKFAIITLDDLTFVEPGGDAMCQCAYKVRLRDPEQGPDLVAAMKERLGIESVHLVVDQDNEEAP